MRIPIGWRWAAAVVVVAVAAFLSLRDAGGSGRGEESSASPAVGPRGPVKRAEASNPAKSGRISVRGIVVDGRATAIPAAEVAAVVEGGRDPVRTVTGPDGRFVLDGLDEESTCMVGARAPGFAPGLQGGIRPGPGEVRLVLRTGIRLRGTVRSGKGAPRAGARVRVLLRYPGVAKPLGGMEVNADEDGGYLFADLPRVEGDVEAAWQGASSGPRRYDPPETGDERVLDIELEIGPSLSGRVRSEDGRPLAGMAVGAGAAGEEGAEPRFRRTVTRDDGTFEIAGLPAKGCVLRVSDDEGRYLREEMDGVLPPRAGLEVVLRADPDAPGRYVFRCVDAAGKAVGRVRVELLGADSDRPCGLGSEAPDREGVYRPARTRAGNYRVVISRADGVCVSETFTVAHGKTTDLGALRLGPGAAVRGRIGVDPPLDASAAFLMRGSSTMPEDRAVDGSGGFLLAGLPPGRGSIRIAHPSAEPMDVPWAAGPGETADLGDLRLRTAAGAIRGLVQAGGVPLPAGSFVRISREDVFGAATLDREAPAAKDGRFEFTGVPAGTWRIDAGIVRETPRGRFTTGQRGRDVVLAEGEQAEVELEAPAR